MSDAAQATRRRGTGANRRTGGTRAAPGNDGALAPRIASTVVLEGFLDAIEARRVYGWVRNPEDVSERCSVAIRCGDDLLGTVTADRERRDLKDAGIGDGRYAFEFSFDSPLDDEARARVVAEAHCADGSASLVLERFERQASNGAPAGELDALKLALGKIAANQIRSFTQHGATMEAISLRLGDLDRRIDTRVRIGGGNADASDMEERLGALEGMHLRFDQALLRLNEERDALSSGEALRARRRVRMAIALVAVLGIVAGMVVEWQLGLLGT